MNTRDIERVKVIVQSTCLQTVTLGCILPVAADVGSYRYFTIECLNVAAHGKLWNSFSRPLSVTFIMILKEQ